MADKRWRQATAAQILKPSTFRRQKRERASFVAGFVGYSGSFRRNPAPNAEARARSALATVLTALQAAHPALIVASGATDLGVPALVYAECARLNIEAIGITADAALNHPLAPMQAVIPVGRRFGDESNVFVELCDAFWILGGGAQSAAEMRLARDWGKPITALQGLGGAADALLPEEWPQTRFVQIS
jgi:hypothetical protein